MVIDNRKALLNKWAGKQLADRAIHVPDEDCLVSASDDASFRRYFRYREADQSFIFVDAPPEKEDSRPFVTIAGYLKDAHLNAPIVYEADYTQGFMMLSDLGKEPYLSAYASEARDTLLEDALQAICTMQLICEPLPSYDETLLRREMDLFPEWFLGEQLGLVISAAETAMLQDVFRLMVENALQQTQTFVHRDFHSRNLMVTRENSPGILDFQDAVNGPVTYDLVSLIRDCYFQLSGEEVTKYVNRFRQLLIEKQRISDVDTAEFRRWFDLVGLQRHLKCAGIFSRLNIRDGKSGYLGDIPLVVQYDRCMRAISGASYLRGLVDGNRSAAS